jgi:hypothetical protein
MVLLVTQLFLETNIVTIPSIRSIQREESHGGRPVGAPIPGDYRVHDTDRLNELRYDETKLTGR